VNHSSIRILLALAAQYNYELDKLDVKTIFLHDDFEEKICMIQPLGFKVTEKKKLVCKLERSLRQWYKRFNKFMSDREYTRSLYHPCVYFRKIPSGEYIYLRLYVDDILVASKNRSSIDKLKVQLSSEFKIKNLGEVRRILGVKIKETG